MIPKDKVGMLISKIACQSKGKHISKGINVSD